MCWAPNQLASTTAAPLYHIRDFLAVPSKCGASFWTTAGHLCVWVQATKRHEYHTCVSLFWSVSWLPICTLNAKPRSCSRNIAEWLPMRLWSVVLHRGKGLSNCFQTLDETLASAHGAEFLYFLQQWRWTDVSLFPSTLYIIHWAIFSLKNQWDFIDLLDEVYEVVKDTKKTPQNVISFWRWINEDLFISPSLLRAFHTASL